MSEQASPIVAALANRAPHHFKAIAMSPTREHAIVAGKDTLHVLGIDSEGIREIRSVQVSQVSFQVVQATNKR